MHTVWIALTCAIVVGVFVSFGLGCDGSDENSKSQDRQDRKTDDYMIEWKGHDTGYRGKTTVHSNGSLTNGVTKKEGNN